MFKLIADSSCDVFKMEDVNFKAVPLKIIAGDKEFIDDGSGSVSDMIEYLSSYKGKSGSSCPSSYDYLEAYEGGDDIFVVTITSGLSGSFNAANAAKEMYLQKYHGKNIYIIDSLSAGPELTLIIEKIKELYISGSSFSDIVDEIKKYKEKLELVFISESLRNLANNGRVSHTVAALANILGIRIIGKASEDGVLEPLGKARGEKNGIKALFKNMLNNGYKGQRVIISHCFNEQGAKFLEEKIKEVFLNAKIKIQNTGMLCGFYVEKGGILVGFEK